MKKDRVCPYCHKEFAQAEGRVFSNHVRWCEKNPRHDELGGKTFRENAAKKTHQRKINRDGELKTFVVTCAVCGKQFEVVEHEKLFPSRERYYCSRSCANTREVSLETRKKMSKSFYKTCPVEKRRIYFKSCCICGKLYDKPRPFKTCSQACHSKMMSKRYAALALKKFKEYVIGDTHYSRLTYRSAAQFRFPLQNYPEEFDFEMITRLGWYAAKNHGDNPNGVSRDHMYSVCDGYENKVDPRIIAHPANCRLITQRENCSKNKQSCITYDELIARIHAWDAKYGQFYPDFLI